jgi:tRNA(fMet)-specific endonuclease VapC
MSPPAPVQPTLLQPVVVDTDVVSYIFKGDTRAARYELHLVGQVPVLSFMTVAELDVWADQRDWGRRARERLEQFLSHYPVQYPDRRLCRIWAAVSTAGRRSGRPIQAADAWIAATALFLNAPLVTNNPSDYAGLPGLTVLSEP